MSTSLETRPYTMHTMYLVGHNNSLADLSSLVSRPFQAAILTQPEGVCAQNGGLKWAW